MHADLYRVRGAEGIGLEDYFDTHLCLIEWPDRLGEMIDPASTWRVRIAFTGPGRSVTVERPA
jgi:tRNA threonylcarbamoyladenosine biosynthesis protein TsaE